MLGSLILYLKGMRIMMFQLSGFYCIGFRARGLIWFGDVAFCRAQGAVGKQRILCLDLLKPKEPIKRVA